MKIDVLRTRASLTPDRPAVRCASCRSWTSFGEADALADGIARALLGRRQDTDRRMATLMLNRDTYVSFLFACLRSGSTAVPLNWRLSDQEIVAILADCGARHLVVDDVHFLRGTRIVERCRAAGAGTALVRFEDLVREGSGSAAGGTAPVRPEWDQEWYLIYTSGTTGQPKGVVQTPQMAMGNFLNTNEVVRFRASDVSLNVLPQFHTSGINLYLLPMVLAGGSSVVQPRFDAAEAIGLLQDGVTLFFGVPTMYEMLVEVAGERPPAPGTAWSVRSWGVGGAPIAPATLQALHAVDIHPQNTFGMTESGPIVCMASASEAREAPLTVGRGLPYAEVDLVGQESSRWQERPGDAQRYRLRVRGPGVSPGYVRGDAVVGLTDGHGWLDTGDVVERDERGLLYVVDRAKNMFISGGENVYPAEVESVLVTHPLVEEGCVVPVPDDRWGEVGKAYVVLAAGTDPSPTWKEDVAAHVRDRLAAYKVPKEWVAVESLPRNATGKLLRHELT